MTLQRTQRTDRLAQDFGVDEYRAHDIGREIERILDGVNIPPLSPSDLIERLLTAGFIQTEGELLCAAYYAGLKMAQSMLQDPLQNGRITIL